MPKKKEPESSLNDKDNREEVAEIEYITPKTKVYKAKKEDLKELPSKLKKVTSEIDHLKKENEKLKEETLRQIAEMDNLRKRIEREKTEFYQYALSELIKDLLAILDNFERALESQDQGNGKSFREGVEMIYKQYFDLIMKQGVSPIEIKGKKFDPHLHQAFITEESEEAQELEIKEELQKGYMLHNRLLRPSLVKVIVPKKEK